MPALSQHRKLNFETCCADDRGFWCLKWSVLLVTRFGLDRTDRRQPLAELWRASKFGRRRSCTSNIKLKHTAEVKFDCFTTTTGTWSRCSCRHLHNCSPTFVGVRAICYPYWTVISSYWYTSQLVCILRVAAAQHLELLIMKLEARHVRRPSIELSRSLRPACEVHGNVAGGQQGQQHAKHLQLAYLALFPPAVSAMLHNHVCTKHLCRCRRHTAGNALGKSSGLAVHCEHCQLERSDFHHKRPCHVGPPSYLLSAPCQWCPV